MSTPSSAGPSAAIPSTAEARALLNRATQFQSAIRHTFDEEARSRDRVAEAYGRLRERTLRQDLSLISLDQLKTVSDGRLRLGPLERAGILNVQQVLDTPVSRLSLIQGIGERTAKLTVSAATQIEQNAREHIHVRIDSETAPGWAWETVNALYRAVSADDALSGIRADLQSLTGELDDAIALLRVLTSRVRRIFASRSRRANAGGGATRVDSLLAGADIARLSRGLDAAAATLAAPIAQRRAVIADFERRAARYHSLLDSIVRHCPVADAAHGYLPDERVKQIQRHHLDVSLLRTSLRGYQAFGARFALERRRVILGDEMGTGKTVQAIAAMAHLATSGRSHFLVVCPASVLINWTREIADHSTLTAHKVHGPDKQETLGAWIDIGGIAVTTFDTLRSILVPPAVQVAMLVVDEAHFVKNPQAQRSLAVHAWTQRVDRVLFLTGTPMENKVEEFRNLVGYLQPAIARSVTGLDGASGAKAFRRAVAPVYLRRNQEDVLAELPEVVHIDEWEEFGHQDFAAYRKAVLKGNFMDMRQAAYSTGGPAKSAKLRRLLDIAQEAGDNGRKVVVFSYFREVLETVQRNLPADVVHGPLTGSTPPARRQQLVDTFTSAVPPAVLVSQIVAGGTGLNLQAASVVILCEPQVKPSSEHQAIARAHRMGQTWHVNVHRLLVADSIDQRLLEILNGKVRLFDAYARRSETANAHPEATDISEAEITARIVSQERHRLKAWPDRS